MLLTIEISAAVFETLLIFIFLHSFFPVQDKDHPFVFYSVFCLLNCFLSIQIENAPLRMALLTALLFIFIISMFECQLWAAFGASILFSAIAIVVDLICIGILNFFHLNLDHLMQVFPYRGIFVVLAKTVQLAIILMLSTFGKQQIFDLPFLKIFPLLLCQIFTILLCTLLWESIDWLSKTEPIILTAALIGVLYTNIILFGYLIDMKTGYEAIQEKIITEHQLQMQIDYYEKLHDEQERTRSMWHDMQKQLSLIASLVPMDSSQASLCMQELQTQFQQIGNIARFDNAVLSSILSDGIRRAKEKGIAVECDVVTAAHLDISPLLLNVIIGNTFDNAIRACELIQDPCVKKEIKISIKQRGHILQYEIRNPYDAQVVENRDKELHGYGLPNVHKSIARNDGSISIQKKNGIFHIHVLLNV